MELTRNKNTSFSTTPETFWKAKELAAKEQISLSQLVDRALRKEIEQLEQKHHLRSGKVS